MNRHPDRLRKAQIRFALALALLAIGALLYLDPIRVAISGN
jgi:predicted nucleic acid-binding Zn ribbon protein